MTGVAIAAIEKKALGSRVVTITLAIIAFGLAAFLFGRCSVAPAGGITPKIAAAIDTEHTQNAADQTLAQLDLRSAMDERGKARADSARAAAFALAAKRQQARADSLAIVAARSKTLADSAAAYHRAYDAEHAANDSLRAENDAKSAELAHANTSIPLYAQADSADQRRAVRTDAIENTVAKALAESEPRCRMLFVNCPSRKVALVAGVVGAVLVYEAPKIGKALSISIKL